MPRIIVIVFQGLYGGPLSSEATIEEAFFKGLWLRV